MHDLVFRSSIAVSPDNMQWLPNRVSIAGNRGIGDRQDQFNEPWGLCIHENQSILIADAKNHRVMRWQAGGNGRGDRLDQLSAPSDAFIHRQNASVLICDFANRRIVE